MDESLVLKRLSQFVLNRQTDNMRKELQEFLVGMVLFSNGEFATLNLEEVIEGIDEVFGLKSFPHRPIQDALSSMLQRGDIEEHLLRNEKKFALSQLTRNKIGVLDKDYDNIRTRVESELVDCSMKLFPRISSSKQTLVIKCFDLVLGQICESTSKSAASAYLGSPYERINVQNEGVAHCIETAVCRYFRGNNRAKVIEIISDYLEEPSETLASYLHSISSSYYIIQVLHLDPECQHLTKDELSERKFYLDTNAIFKLLTGKKKTRKAIERLLEISTELGMTPYVTSRTKEEFMTVLHYHKYILSKSTMTTERYEKVSDLVADDILKDFMEKKKQNPSLRVDGYFARLELVENVLSNWGIQFEDVDFSEMFDHPDFERLIARIVELRPWKSDGVAEHDANHILWVDELRKSEESGVTGPKHWFLTFDTSLPFAERMYANHDRLQTSVNADQWLQMLTPFLAPDISIKEVPYLYATLFSTRLPAAAPLLRGEDLLKIQGTWIDDENLGANELKQIIGNNYVQSYLQNTPSDELSIEGFQKALEPLLKEIKDLKDAEIETLAGIESSKKWILGAYVLLSIIVDSVTYFVAPIQLLAIFVGAEIAIIAFLREEVREIIGLGTKKSID